MTLAQLKLSQTDRFDSVYDDYIIPILCCLDDIYPDSVRYIKERMDKHFYAELEKQTLKCMLSDIFSFKSRHSLTDSGPDIAIHSFQKAYKDYFGESGYNVARQYLSQKDQIFLGYVANKIQISQKLN